MLIHKIRRRIAETGPLSVAAYMEMCLTDPEFGFYMGHCPMGVDFITAPEVSQLFGEMIALHQIQLWQKMGSPGAIALVEFGPGRGTLMMDLLRTWRKVVPETVQIQVILVEVSPHLKEVQASTLGKFSDSIIWLAEKDPLPQKPTFVVANEFLDALPIHQFVKEGDEWRERVIDLDLDGEAQGGSHGDCEDGLMFPLVWRQASLQASQREADHPVWSQKIDGLFFEYCPEAFRWLKCVSLHIQKWGGAGLVIDYGYVSSCYGDTFQGVRQGKYASVFDSPGEVDLTAHVDFFGLHESLSALANEGNFQVDPIVSQKKFLEALGIQFRAQQLMRDGSEKQNHDLQSGLRRLTHVEEMGNLFKVLSFFSSGSSLGQ